MNCRDLQYLADAISEATVTALEEMGLVSQDAESLVTYFTDWGVLSNAAILRGLANYQRKLEITGGRPKPRFIESQKALDNR